MKRLLQNKYLPFFVFLLLSSLARIIFFVYVRGYNFFTDYVTGDQLIYLQNAKYFLSLNWDEITIIHPPLYSFYLAFIMSLFGERIVPILISQFLLDGISAYILFRLSELFMERRYSFYTGLVYCIYPSFIYMSNQLLSETLFLFIFIGATFFIVAGIKNRNWLCFFASGLLFGIGSLTRAHIVGLIFLIPFILYFIIKDNRKKITIYILVFILTAFFVILPWELFLYMKYDTIVVISAKLGRTLWGTHNPYGYSRYLAPFTKEGETWPDNLNEAELDRYLLRKALRYIRDNPSSIYRVGLRNLWVTIKPPTGKICIYSGFSFLILIITGLIYFVVILMGVWGVIRLKSNKESVYSIFLLYIVFTLLISFLLKGELRYRLPLMPFFILFTFYNLSKLKFNNWKLCL